MPAREELQAKRRRGKDPASLEPLGLCPLAKKTYIAIQTAISYPQVNDYRLQFAHISQLTVPLSALSRYHPGDFEIGESNTLVRSNSSLQVKGTRI